MEGGGSGARGPPAPGHVEPEFSLQKENVTIPSKNDARCVTDVIP